VGTAATPWPIIDTPSRDRSRDGFEAIEPMR
jgi:hypothetical protein